MTKWNWLTKYLMVCFFLLLIQLSHAQVEPVFPVPEGNPNQLFYLQRTTNANTVVYELNIKNGELNQQEPIHAFWIRYGENGQRAELSAVQRNFAYGIKTSMISPENFEIRLVSYKKTSMYLKKNKDNKYCVFTSINEKPAILCCIYLKINGGPVFSPKIEYAELRGTDEQTGEEVAEKIKIHAE